MSFQPGVSVYTQGFGVSAENVQVPHIEKRNPSISDLNYPIGKRWVNTELEQEFVLYSFQRVGGITQANWGTTAGPSGSLETLSDTLGTTVSPNITGNIQLSGTSGQISIVANPASNSFDIGISNPLTITGLTATGPVNLCTTGSQPLTIGNTSGTGQEITIQSNDQIRIASTGSGTVNIGNSTGSVTFDGKSEFDNGVVLNGALASPDKGLTAIDSTLAFRTSINFTGPITYNALGGESEFKCNSTAGQITINLSNNITPGSLVLIYDFVGEASNNHIIVNAPSGGNFIQNGQSPGPSYAINTNYGNLLLYAIPNGALTLNYLIINNTNPTFQWSTLTSSAIASANNGYFIAGGALVNIMLPSTCGEGSIIEVVGRGPSQWRILYGTGQSIVFNSSITTPTTGSLTSTEATDCVRLVCTVENTTFEVISSQGNPTIA